MNTWTKKSDDPIEKLIFEKGLRIKHVIALKKEDCLIVLLNNNVNISLKLSQFKLLKKAKQEQLDKWVLIGKGVGIEWTELDEDLSLKGMIKHLIIENTLRFVGGENSNSLAA